VQQNRVRQILLGAAAALLAFTLAASVSPAAAVTPNSAGPGYTSMGVTATYPQRVVRIATGTPANVRFATLNVVQQINSAAGYTFLTMGPDLGGTPGRHEILVKVSPVVNCGAPGAAGCFSAGTLAAEGQRYVVNATVEIGVDGANGPHLTPILLHEMGHAIGLAHHDHLYLNQRQIMGHSVNEDMVSYRTGDRNGIRDLVNSYNNPNGNVDVSYQSAPGRATIRGWAFDSNAPMANIDVHVYVDGKYRAAAPTGVTRTDVAAAKVGSTPTSGFHVHLDGLAAGVRNVCVYAINVGLGNTNPLLGCRATRIGGKPFGSVDTAAVGTGRTITVAGWAIDPDTVNPILVHAYINGKYSRQVTANLARSDVGKTYPGYGPHHGYSVSIPNVPPGKHSVCLYAINAGPTTPNPLLGCRTISVPFAG